MLTLQTKPDKRWAWVDGPSGTRLELYSPQYADFIAYLQKHKFSGEFHSVDLDGAMAYVAENWMRGVEGVQDEAGNPLGEIAKQRLLILRSAGPIWKFVHDYLQKSAERTEEGNAGSSSA